MIRFAVFFALIGLMTFLALYEGSARFNDFKRDIMIPLMGWKKIEAVDERWGFEVLLDEVPWMLMEKWLLGIVAIMVGVTMGWRARGYSSVCGTNIEPDSLEKFLEKQKHIEERLDMLELKVNRFEIKCSMGMELIYSRDCGEGQFSSTVDAIRQMMSTEWHSQTCERGSYPSSVADVEAEGEEEDLRVWATASNPELTTYTHPETVEYPEHDITLENEPKEGDAEDTERTLYEVEVYPVEIDLGQCEPLEDPEENTPDNSQVEGVEVVDTFPYTGMAETLPYKGVAETLPHVGVEEILSYSGVEETVPYTGVEKTVPYMRVDETIPYAGVEETVPYMGMEETVPYMGVEETLPYARAAETIPYTVGAGECESKKSSRERRIPQLQGLRRVVDQKVREERPVSATRVLEALPKPAEVTKLPRASPPRRYNTDGVESLATARIARRRKQRQSQIN